MLPSKIKLQLLPRAKVSGKVRSVGKLVTDTRVHC